MAPKRLGRRAAADVSDAHAPLPETAIVVLVPEAEPLLARHRAGRNTVHHSAAPPDLPAHVTVLFPFRPSISRAESSSIGGHAALVPAFEVRFGRAECFPGGVVYLAPEPMEPFRDLTLALADVFPDSPPYGGEFAEIVPHLTVADGLDPTEARSLCDDLDGDLPIVAEVTHLSMLCHDDEAGWRAEHTWPLGRPSE